MNNSRNGNHKNPAEKRRAAPRQKVDELMARLTEREAELATCQESLRKAQTAAGEMTPLSDELSQCQRLLKDGNEELERLRKQARQFEENIAILQGQEKRLREENTDLKRAKVGEREKAIKLVDEAKAEQRNSERASRELDRNLRESGETTIASDDGVSLSDEPPTTDAEPIAAPTATFRIDLYPWQGHYVGKIEHTLSQHRKPFKGLDHTLIMDFISTHLPHMGKKPDTELMVHAAPTIGTQVSNKERPAGQVAPAPTATSLPTGIVQDIEILQDKHLIQAKPPVVRDGRPFMVRVHLHLPSPPTQNVAALQFPSYSVRLIAQMRQSAEAVAEEVVADDLAPQTVDYEKAISMPALKPGRYILHAYTLVPFAHIAEHDKIELSVA